MVYKKFEIAMEYPSYTSMNVILDDEDNLYMSMEAIVDKLNELSLINNELNSEVEKLTAFIVSEGYTVEDFNKWLVEQWE